MLERGSGKGGGGGEVRGGREKGEGEARGWGGEGGQRERGSGRGWGGEGGLMGGLSVEGNGVEVSSGIGGEGFVVIGDT